MNIERLIAKTGEQGRVQIEGLTLSVSVLNKLRSDGYLNLKPHKDNNTISVWGKNRTATFFVDKLQGTTEST